MQVKCKIKSITNPRKPLIRKANKTAVKRHPKDERTCQQVSNCEGLENTNTSNKQAAAANSCICHSPGLFHTLTGTAQPGHSGGLQHSLHRQI